jgi:L-serine dehydratase
MKTSLFEIFKIDIGPRSSHTVGPMRAAGDFVAMLGAQGALIDVTVCTALLFASKRLND